MLFIYLIIIINVIIFILSNTGKLDIDYYSMSYYSVSVKKEYHRVLTSSFMHGNVPHILMNMIALYNIGSVLVYYIGTFRLILAYFITMIDGHIFTLLLRHSNHDDYTSSIGASGAICGLVGVYLVIIFRLAGGAAFHSIVRSLFSIILISVLPGIDGKSHICCLAAGIVLGFIYCLI